MDASGDTTLGAKIRNLRIQKGLTQGELARGEITPGLISQIESDRIAPSSRVVALLAEQLGVKPEEIWGDVEARQEQIQLVKGARERLAERRGEEALAILKRVAEAPVSYVPVMELKLDIAYARYLTGDSEDALSLYKEVELHATRHGDFALGHVCMSRQGELHQNAGRHTLAFYCFSVAYRQLLETSGPEPRTLLTLRRNLCIAAYRIGDMKRALDLAQATYDELTDTAFVQEKAEICHILSVLLGEAGTFDLAMQYAGDAVTLYRRLGLEYQVADARLNQAILLREAGKHDLAMQILPAIIAEYYRQDRSDQLANAWAERALCELAAGKLEEAKRSLERSFNLLRPDTPIHAEAWRIQGMVHAISGELDQAEEAYQKAAELAERTGLPVTGRAVAAALCDLFERSGRPVEAERQRARTCELAAVMDGRLRISAILGHV